MSRVVVLYHSQMGHTEKVAEYIADGLRKRGFVTDLMISGEVPEDFGAGYTAAVVVGSVHHGHHAEALAELVKRHRDALRGMITALCSVSIEAAVVEVAETPVDRGTAEIELHKPISKFMEATDWLPTLVEPVAGAIPYAHVGPFRRLLLKRMAGNSHLPTDTTQDHVLTDWEALDRFVETFADKARVMA